MKTTGHLMLNHGGDVTLHVLQFKHPTTEVHVNFER